MKRKKSNLVIWCLITIGMSYQAVAQQSNYRPYLDVDCLKEIDGQLRHVEVEIDLRQPDIDVEDGWGTARRYEVAESTKTNCNGVAYAYWEIEVDHEWIQEQAAHGGIHTFTHADNKRFWDWYYEGYEKPDACDYTQNCHGYAFGVGDWPDSAEPIIDRRPVTDPPTPGPDPCYIPAEVKDATIASDPPEHSIKVQGAECEVELPPGPPIPLPDPGPGGPAIVQALVASWEQYRESGTYSQTATCPDSVNLKRPGKWHNGYNLDIPDSLLKPKSQ